MLDMWLRRFCELRWLARTRKGIKQSNIFWLGMNEVKISRAETGPAEKAIELRLDRARVVMQ